MCCQVAGAGSAEARRGAGWGDALPDVCGGSGKPVGYGPAVPRRSEQKRGTGRRQDFPFFAETIENASFPAAVASLALPPAPARPRHPQISCGLRRSPEEDGGRAGRRERSTGKQCVWAAGARGDGQGRRQRLGKGDRAPVSSRQLSSQRLRPTPRAMRPRGAKPTGRGRLRGADMSAARSPGLPKLRRAPAPPHACPRPLLSSLLPCLQTSATLKNWESLR